MTGNPLLNLIFGVAISAIDITSGSGTIVPFDTLSSGNRPTWIGCLIQVGNIDVNSTVLKLITADTSSDAVNNTGTAADITGAALTGSSLPLASGGDDTLRGIFCPLVGTKRYIGCLFTAGSGHTLTSAVWIAGGANQTPSSVTERGLSAQAIVA